MSADSIAPRVGRLGNGGDYYIVANVVVADLRSKRSCARGSQSPPSQWRGAVILVRSTLGTSRLAPRAVARLNDRNVVDTVNSTTTFEGT